MAVAVWFLGLKRQRQTLLLLLLIFRVRGLNRPLIFRILAFVCLFEPVWLSLFCGTTVICHLLVKTSQSLFHRRNKVLKHVRISKECVFFKQVTTWQYTKNTQNIIATTQECISSQFWRMQYHSCKNVYKNVDMYAILIHINSLWPVLCYLAFLIAPGDVKHCLCLSSGFNCRIKKPKGPRDPPAEWSRAERWNCKSF